VCGGVQSVSCLTFTCSCDELQRSLRLSAKLTLCNNPATETAPAMATNGNEHSFVSADHVVGARHGFGHNLHRLHSGRKSEVVGSEIRSVLLYDFEQLARIVFSCLFLVGEK